MIFHHYYLFSVILLYFFSDTILNEKPWINIKPPNQYKLLPPSVHLIMKQDTEWYLLEVLKIYKVKNPLMQETLVCTLGPEENLVPVPLSSPCRLSGIKNNIFLLFTDYHLYKRHTHWIFKTIILTDDLYNRKETGNSLDKIPNYAYSIWWMYRLMLYQ